MKIEVLDQGHVELLDNLGSDLLIVNAARVSFGKRSTKFDEKDRKLLEYLAKNKHHSPFRHPHIVLHIKAPEICLRQMYKHVVGIETTSGQSCKDHAWNELSMRYIEPEDAIERAPGDFRQQSTSNKQGSAGAIQDDLKQKILSQKRAQFMKLAREQYEFEIEKGVAKEMARECLTFATYTEVIWTASFQALMNFIELRDKPDAQWEIQEYARAITRILEKLYPESTRAWKLFS